MESTVSDLVVIEFPSEAKAEEVRQKVLDMQKDYLIELGDAVIAVKQPNGRVKLNQLFHPAAAGAAYGSMWGLLVGMIFLMPLAGAAIGTAVSLVVWNVAMALFLRRRLNLLPGVLAFFRIPLEKEQRVITGRERIM